MISYIFDLFYPHPPKPTFDLFLTDFHVFKVMGPLGRLCFFFCSGAGGGEGRRRLRRWPGGGRS